MGGLVCVLSLDGLRRKTKKKAPKQQGARESSAPLVSHIPAYPLSHAPSAPCAVSLGIGDRRRKELPDTMRCDPEEKGPAAPPRESERRRDAENEREKAGREAPHVGQRPFRGRPGEDHPTTCSAAFQAPLLSAPHPSRLPSTTPHLRHRPRLPCHHRPCHPTGHSARHSAEHSTRRLPRPRLPHPRCSRRPQQWPQQWPPLRTTTRHPALATRRRSRHRREQPEARVALCLTRMVSVASEGAAPPARTPHPHVPHLPARHRPASLFSLSAMDAVAARPLWRHDRLLRTVPPVLKRGAAELPN